MMLHSAYLFEAEAYRQTIAPLILEIEAGDYKALYQLALDTVQANPEIWLFLEHLRMGNSIEDFDHELVAGSVRYWLIVVLGQFVRSTYSMGNYWSDREILRAVLPLAGWVSEEITMLFVGKSMCFLLAPHYVPDSAIRSSFINGRFPWCEFGRGAGWLELATIQYLHTKLLRTRADYPALASKPQTQQIIQKLYGEVREDRLWTICEEVEKMLSSAIGANKELFLVTD